MSRRRREVSAAARVFAIIVACAVVLAGGLAAILIVDAQRSQRENVEQLTAAVARSIAVTPSVASALAGPAASVELQPVAERTRESAGMDFVTIMTPDGIRVTHPNPDEVGRPYLGTVPDAPLVASEEFTGTLGPSVRTIAPIESEGELVGWVAAGRTLGTIQADVRDRVGLVAAFSAGVTAIGIAAALIARRVTRRVAGDLPAGSIRDAIASYESVRTLGEALRAQTHEHGNRIHTALSLIELGRVDEATGLLAATAEQSQAAVDQVTARREGDPTVGALLLGKAAQARERGIDWRATIAPDAPRSTLDPIDAVSVVGNIIDNALDAAAASSPERRVWVDFAREGTKLSITVGDSGPGVPPELRERVFDRGFSTKPSGEEGRGIGLALVRSIVDEHGGSIEIGADPSTVRVILPGRVS